MKKYLFLIVVGTLITFSSCKKEETKILGEWELVSSTICDDTWGKLLPIAYVFEEYSYYAIVNNKFNGGLDNEIFSGKYSIQNNTITFETVSSSSSGAYPYINTRYNSLKISFSGTKKMIWKSENDKYTFKKK